MSNNIVHLLYDYLIELGISESFARYLNLVGLFLAMLFLVGILDFIIKRVIRKTSIFLARKTKTNLDDIAITNKPPTRLAHIFPPISLGADSLVLATLNI